ncbi:Arginase [Saitozyma sp. JCM 24511]|nr:Arginase [Saitozyma sp. JCM 24511]
MSPNYKYRFLSEPATVDIIACPFSGGQGRSGVDLAPNRLISAGLVDQLQKLGWQVKYESAKSFADIPYNPVPTDAQYTHLAGDKPVNAEEFPTPKASIEPVMVQRLPDPDIGKMKKPRLVSAVCERVAKEVGEAAAQGALPLTLGGDHSLIDAHADINTPGSTDSGNLHGCPVSFLLGLEGTDVEPFNQWIKPCLKPEDLVYIGLRDLDVPEKAILRKHNIKCFTMHEVDKYGIGKVMDMALDYVNPSRDRPTHLTFDVDALDPSVAPSTGTPVRGGLTFREGHYITEAVAETGCLVSLDIMEVNPSLLDPVSIEQTVAVGCSLARAALGETLL